MLECAAAAADGVSLKELAAAAGSSEPAAFHMAATLVACGYLRRQENPVRFFLGGKVFSLAQSTDGWMSQIETWILQIRQQMPDTNVFYCVARGQDICVVLQDIENISSENRHKTYVLAPYTSVGSMVHLAFWQTVRANQYRKQHSFDANGAVLWKTETDLEAELEKIRDGGEFFFPQKDPCYLRLGVPLVDEGGVLRGSFTVAKNLPEGTAAAEIRKAKKEISSLVRSVVCGGA